MKKPRYETGSNPQGDEYDFEPYKDDEETPVDIHEADLVDATGKPILQQYFADIMMVAEALLPHGGMNALVKVVWQSVDDNEKVTGSFNENPIFNMLVYDCKFSDGTIKEYAANIITENIFNECDLDRYRDRMMLKFIDHKRNGDALRHKNCFITTQLG